MDDVISFLVYDFRFRRRLWPPPRWWTVRLRMGLTVRYVSPWTGTRVWPPTPGTQVSRDFSNVSLPVPVYTHALREDICGTLEDKGRWGRRRRLPIGRRRPLLSQWREWRPSWPTPTAPSLFLPFLTFPFLSLPFHSFPESAPRVCTSSPPLP